MFIDHKTQLHFDAEVVNLGCQLETSGKRRLSIDILPPLYWPADVSVGTYLLVNFCRKT